MAKSNAAAMINQHIEKIVLGLCVLLLLYAVFAWMLGGEKQIEVARGLRGSTEVPISQADDTLVDAAHQVQRWHEDGRYSSSPQPDWTLSMRDMIRTPLPEWMIPLNSWAIGEQAPSVRVGKIKKVSLASLVEAVPAPSAPRAWAGPELRRLSNASDTNVARGVAELDWSTHAARWSTILRRRGLRGEPIVARVEIQRAEVKPDGSLGEYKSVETVRRPFVDAQGQNVPVSVPSIPDYTGDNAAVVRKAVETLAGRSISTGMREDDRGGAGTVDYQRILLQPRYWDIWYSAGKAYGWVPWEIHLPQTELTQKYASTYTDPNMLRVELSGDDSTDDRDYREYEDEQDEEEYRPRRSGRGDRVIRRGEEDRGGGRYGEEEEYRPRRPIREDRDRTEDRPRRGRQADADEEEIVAPRRTPVPTLSQQRSMGKVLVWFHDVGIRPRTQYRYRLRVVYVNPVLANTEADRVLEDPNSAKVKTIASPWSKWSAPMAVENKTEFFVTGGNERFQQVTVTVFTRTMGQLVGTKFYVVPGQPIGGTETVTVDVPQVEGNTVVAQERKVDFSTANLAVDFDFSRMSLGKGDILARRTVGMVYLDAEGQLRTRVAREDQKSERLKELQKEAN
jgi:hypothetical protein